MAGVFCLKKNGVVPRLEEWDLEKSMVSSMAGREGLIKIVTTHMLEALDLKKKL